MKAELTRARILVADDDVENARTVEEALTAEGHQIRTIHEGESALKLVRTWAPHIVLLDINMPKMTGIEVLKKVRSLSGGEYIGVILVTANAGLEEIVAGLDAGADDYIVKPYRLLELKARVRACLRTKALHDSLRRANGRLEELTNRDELTSLFNMRYVARRLGDELAQAQKTKRPASCLMFDMDRFKSVNDRFGHLVGSQVLREVAQLIVPLLRTTDIAARYGGDEFLVAMPETRSKEACDMAERMRRKIETHPFPAGDQVVQLTASFGVAALEDAQTLASAQAQDLIRQADLALYAAKEKGRNRVEKL